MHYDNRIISINYSYNYYVGNDSKDLQVISECVFENGILMKYEYALCNIYLGGKGCTEIRIETYGYENGKLNYCMMEDCNSNVSIVRRTEYIFSHDNEEFPSSYTTFDYDNETRISSFWDGHVFEISEKRKV